MLRSLGFGLGLETFANFLRVSVSVSENVVSEKKYRFRFRKNFGPKNSNFACKSQIFRISFQNMLRSLGLGFGLKTFAKFLRVSVLVSKNLVSEKKSWFQKNLVSEKSLGFGFREFGLLWHISIIHIWKSTLPLVLLAYNGSLLVIPKLILPRSLGLGIALPELSYSLRKPRLNLEKHVETKMI